MGWAEIVTRFKDVHYYFSVLLRWVYDNSTHSNNNFKYLRKRRQPTGQNHVERSLKPNHGVKKLRSPPPRQQAKLHLAVIHVI